MSRSILLSVDGSIFTVHAANLCFRIATLTDATITAHHVVDTDGARDFVMREPSGYVLSKEYRSVCSYLSKALWAIGHQLQNRYLLEAGRHGITSSFVIEQGEPVSAVCHRAKSHDLVVIGHKHEKQIPQPSPAIARRSFERSSFAEALSHRCEVPLLIVQDDTESWKTMSIFVSLEHLNERYIDACLDLADLLVLKSIIVCLPSGVGTKPTEQIISELKLANQRLKDVEIQFTTLEKLSDFLAEESDCEVTLPVIPTREIAGARVSLLDVSASAFVHCLSSSAILLVPEEYVEYKAHQLNKMAKLQEAGGVK